MNAKQKLFSQKISSISLLTILFAVLTLSFNTYITAVIKTSRSSHNLNGSDGDATRIGDPARLSRAHSLDNISELTSSESGSSDGESDKSSKLKRAGAAVAEMFRRAGQDADRKLVFFKEKWEKKRAIKRARTAALEARVAAPTAIHTITVSPVYLPADHKHAALDDLAKGAVVDLGDAVPSQVSTVRTLSLVCTPVLTRQQIAEPGPKSPVMEILRHGCFEFYWPKIN